MIDRLAEGRRLIPVLRVRVADVVLDIEADQGFPLDERWDRFRTTARPNVRVEMHKSSGPRRTVGRRVGTLQGIGAVHESAPGLGSIDFGLTGPGGEESHVEFDLRAGQVTYRLGPNLTHDQYADFLLTYVTKAYFLANVGDGLLLHACGVARQGRGLAFAGHSGAGKTTLGKLFEAAGGGRVLNDDTVAVTWRGGLIHLWGTPWTHHGADLVRAEGCPLAAMFFIDHGPANVASPVLGTRLLELILPECAGDWEGPGVLPKIERLCRLGRDVALHELRFVPDRSAVAFVCGLADGAVPSATRHAPGTGPGRALG
jgi:hypothetical protein